jgi:hypothetical protein
LGRGSNIESTSEIGIGLFRCPVAGCDNTPEVLDDNRARGLAVAGGSLYVTHAYSAAIEACPTSGCASPANLLWSDEPWSTNTETIAVAADATDVYWTTRGIVMRCARAGCDNTPTVLASSGNAVWMLGPIALDATTVYFGHGMFDDGTEQRDGEILACAKIGCAGAPSLVATSAYGPVGLACDGINVYWTERDSSLPYSSSGPYWVRKCAVAGCRHPVDCESKNDRDGWSEAPGQGEAAREHVDWILGGAFAQTPKY